MRQLLILALFALPIGTIGCGGEPSAEKTRSTVSKPRPGEGTPAAEDEGAVIAEVGGITITAREFQMAAARQAPSEGDRLSLDDKKKIIDDLLVEKMLYLEAKAKEIDQDPKVQKVMINTLLRQDVYSQVRNSDFDQEELRAYFEAHRDEFVVPEKVQVKRIFIKVGEARDEAEAKKIAQDVYGQVKGNPAQFKDLATRYSEDPYRRRGGDLGFVSKEGKPGIDPEVTAKAFEMEVGQVAEPFLAGGGYNVLLVANKRERVERTFEQMKGSVLRKVKNEKYKELYDTYVADVRKAHVPQVHEDELAQIDVKPLRRLSLVPGGPGGVGDEEEEGHDEGDEHDEAVEE